MADTLERPPMSAPTLLLAPSVARRGVLAALALLAGLLALSVGLGYLSLTTDDPALAESTPYELLVWAAEQSGRGSSALWAQFARAIANARGLDALPVADAAPIAQQMTLAWCAVTAALAAWGAWGIWQGAGWAKRALLLALLGAVGMIFAFPVVEGSAAPALTLTTVGLLVTLVALLPGKLPTVGGVLLAFSVIFMVWQTSKALAESIGYTVTLPQPAWQVVTYDTLEQALDALNSRQIGAVLADKRELEAFMPGHPVGGVTDNPAYPDLRFVQFRAGDQWGIFPLVPEVPGRLNVAVPAAQAPNVQFPSQFTGTTIGAVTGSFALERYLPQPRSLVLLDLKILNNLNLPHLQDIAEAFLQPARRNGEFLLARILLNAGLYTWGEAVFGFVFGALLGLILGTLFAHFKLLERALLPYVVASQTVPILAIAPMIVIWLGASWVSVAVIAVYITFFPVTINTMRGLLSPKPTAVELMESYAASRWTTLWKLRFPSALPYIFAALKVSATASVVGAIIGELPSGIGAGLGRAILDFSSDYSLVSTPKLWAAIITAALIGVSFFLIVSAVERVVLRRYYLGSANQ
jgi:NitT/TauT family transport system permease protein